MRIEKTNPDPDGGLAALIEELERYGGALTVTDEPAATTSSKVVHLVLPDDDYRAKKCREILRQWHNAQS